MSTQSPHDAPSVPDASTDRGVAYLTLTERLRAAFRAAVRSWRNSAYVHTITQISGAEAHVLRNLVNEAGDAGIVDNDTQATEWHLALHGLVEKGLATAYRPTPLGIAIDAMARQGTMLVIG